MDFIYKLYIALFQRAPEKEGVEYWYKELIKNNFDYSLIANEMISAASNYSFYSQYKNIDFNDFDSIRDIIESIYKILFGKSYEDDKEGIDYWSEDVIKYKNLGSVVVNIIKVADMIANKEIKSDEETFKYALAFENRVEVSKYVSQKYKTFDGNFIKFQNFISNVTDNNIEEAVKLINKDFKKPLSYDDLSLGAKSLLINEGAKIKKDEITYSFPSKIPDDYLGNSDLTDNWQPLNEKDKELVRKAFDELSKFLNLSFKEVSSNGDIRFSKIDMNSSEAGFTIQSIVDDEVLTDGVGSDVFLSNSYDVNMNGEDVILHEIGHALGLKHPFEEYPQLIENDNTLYTIMSYTQKETFLPSITVNNRDNGIEYSIKTEPLGRKDYAVYDIEALGFLYGKKDNNLGDSVYNESDLYDNFRFDDIFDNGGIDTLNLSKCDLNTKIYLEGGEKLSSVGESLPKDYIKNELTNEFEEKNISFDYFDEIYEDIVDAIREDKDLNDLIYQGEKNLTLPVNQIENILTGSGDDYIEDNSLDNYISAGSGDDIIVVKEGNDFIDGGDGEDRLKIYDNTSYQEYNYANITYLIFDDKVVAFKNIENFEVIN